MENIGNTLKRFVGIWEQTGNIGDGAQDPNQTVREMLQAAADVEVGDRFEFGHRVAG
jgi:hypothetical protein